MAGLQEYSKGGTRVYEPIMGTGELRRKLDGEMTWVGADWFNRRV